LRVLQLIRGKRRRKGGNREEPVLDTKMMTSSNVAGTEEEGIEMQYLLSSDREV